MPKPPTERKPTEVVADASNDRRQRRRFSKEHKLRILDEADACTERGQLAALLRREGIYSSHLTQWRQQLRAHGEAGLEPKPVGRKPSRDEKDRRIDELERKQAKLERELLIARKVIELQGKAHEILGAALPRIEDDEES
jgi:transposase-like protein